MCVGAGAGTHISVLCLTLEPPEIRPPLDHVLHTSLVGTPFFLLKCV